MVEPETLMISNGTLPVTLTPVGPTTTPSSIAENVHHPPVENAAAPDNDIEEKPIEHALPELQLDSTSGPKYPVTMCVVAPSAAPDAL